MDLVNKYFPELSASQIRQFDLLGKIIADLNCQVNVISRKDIEHLEERHILHSLSIAKQHPFRTCMKVIDAGTGGGFPGLPLAILYPDSEFILSDSIGKKIRLVQEALDFLKLENAKAVHCRVEDIKEKCDLVVSRAVAPLPRLYQWTKGLIRKNQGTGPGGIIALKGGELKTELAPFGKRVMLTPVSTHYEEAFFSTKMIVYLKI